VKEKTRRDLCHALETMVDALIPEFFERGAKISEEPELFWSAVMQMNSILELSERLKCEWVKG